MEQGGESVRFVCEWCLQKIEITNARAAQAEVLGHFTNCPRRSPGVTDEQVRGLADHITDVIAEREEIRIRQAG